MDAFHLDCTYVVRASRDLSSSSQMNDGASAKSLVVNALLVVLGDVGWPRAPSYGAIQQKLCKPRSSCYVIDLRTARRASSWLVLGMHPQDSFVYVTAVNHSPA